MKKSSFASAVAALFFALACPLFARAQSAPPPMPTTHLLAIGTFGPDADLAAARAILPSEVRATVDLYLEGKIEQWYSLKGQTGVVFVLNVTDPAAAREMLEQLPLGQAHLMHFELLELAPLNPLRQLQGMRAGNAPISDKP